MRSIQLVAPRKLEESELPQLPDPGPGEILVKIHAVGICGSDMHWYLDGRIGAFPAAYPQILGHEPAGEVAAMGPGVTEYKLGDKVAIEPTISCGHCEHCLRGRHNNCIRAAFMGSPQAPGLLREYAVVPQHNATIFPANFSYTQATLIEPLAVIMHMLELIEIRPADTVAILGAGPIGMLAAAVARSSGASQVLIADKLPYRLELAQKMGATLPVEMKNLAEAAQDVTRGRGFDIVIDAAGMPQTINAGIAIARIGGTFVLIGIPVESNFPVDLQTAMFKELRIQTLKRSNHRSQPAIALLASGAVKDTLITHVVPLDRTADAFETLAEYRDEVGKLVIEMPSAAAS
jgi:L-iditol 2-dehydrogenase